MDCMAMNRTRISAKRTPHDLVVFGLLLATGLFSSGALAECADSSGPGVDWSKCDKRLLILSNQDMSKGQLARTDFGRSDLSGAKLADVAASGATFDYARLRGADLSRAKLLKITAYRADFGGARLVGADLNKAELPRTNFTKANLSGANLRKAELSRSTLQGAHLTRANLAGADLARANLKGAKLAGAKFKNARLFQTRIEGVDLSAVIGLRQRQVNEACGDANTKLPSGLNHPASWPCRLDD
jgi:uncharacterized protein YjbI with pentapeptide repeats